MPAFQAFFASALFTETASPKANNNASSPAPSKMIKRVTLEVIRGCSPVSLSRMSDSPENPMNCMITAEMSEIKFLIGLAKAKA